MDVISFLVSFFFAFYIYDDHDEFRTLKKIDMVGPFFFILKKRNNIDLMVMVDIDIFFLPKAIRPLSLSANA